MEYLVMTVKESFFKRGVNWRLVDFNPYEATKILADLGLMMVDLDIMEFIAMWDREKDLT